MNVDLNIDNYNYDDLLNLFNINHNFNETDLKQCYKKVIKTHPDKSGLGNEYFLFYTKAFKMIKNIYEYKNKNTSSLNNKNSKIEYLALSDEDAGKQLLVDNLQKKKASDFNTWFNETFEKININSDINNGHGDWFKSNENISETNIKSVNQLHEKINQKKEALSALVKINEINDFSTMGNTNELDISQPDSYSANIFSKLQYDDLKKAHTESVIPVCDNDYNKIKKFSNVTTLRDFRNNQNLKPMSKEQARETLDTNHNNLDKINTELAYKLTQQAEAAEKANTFVWNSIRSIK